MSLHFFGLTSTVFLEDIFMIYVSTECCGVFFIYGYICELIHFWAHGKTTSLLPLPLGGVTSSGQLAGSGSDV